MLADPQHNSMPCQVRTRNALCMGSLFASGALHAACVVEGPSICQYKQLQVCRAPVSLFRLVAEGAPKILRRFDGGMY